LLISSMPNSDLPLMSARLLIVDDDVELCQLLSTYLTRDGYEVQVTHDGESAGERIRAGGIGLVLLDVGLPGANGFDVLRRIRGESSVPVLMLTARGEEIDRIVGLELGADDYLPKPFNPRELSARIQAILRRSRRLEPAASNERIVVGDLEMNVGSRSVKRDGQVVELTGVEFSLLELLLQAAGRVVPRDTLFMSVLGRREMPDDRSLDMHVSNLRKKLGHKAAEAERIKTVRGVGYVYALPGETQRHPQQA